MVRLAVINLKGLVKGIMKVIAILLILAMVIKVSKLMYHAVKKFDLESIILQNKLEMMSQNLNIAQSFQEEPSEKSELKKILVAELAVFSGAEEEIMEKENQEESSGLVVSKPLTPTIQETKTGRPSSRPA